MFSNSQPHPVFCKVVRWEYINHPETKQLRGKVLAYHGAHPNYSVCDGILFFKGKVWLPTSLVLHPLLLVEFHITPMGGYAEIQRTLARISTVFYWSGIAKMVSEYVAQYPTCQAVKPFNRAPQGLLQPLPIPGKIWQFVAMDFITGLPPSNGKTTILVVVDRLTKHAHFAALGVTLTAPQVAETLNKEVIKLHGVLA